jgi:hypothetical protein
MIDRQEKRMKNLMHKAPLVLSLSMTRLEPHSILVDSGPTPGSSAKHGGGVKSVALPSISLAQTAKEVLG